MTASWHEEIFHSPEAGEIDVARSVIVKVSGETCNINCFYCYEKRKPYPSARYLSAETLRAFFERLGPGPLAIELHGGEPLIVGKDRMRDLLTAIGERPDVVRLSIQTNGTLLDDEWLDLFQEFAPRLEIGVSLDGDESANALRADYLDQSTFDTVARALTLLDKRKVSCGAICVVSSANVDRPHELMAFFRQWPAIKSLSFVPCFDFSASPKRIPRHNAARLTPMLAVPGEAPAWAISPRQYSTFLVDAAASWIDQQLYEAFALEPIMSVIRKLEGRHTGLCHFTNLKCGQVMTLYPDGRIGTCDELPLPAGLIGKTQVLDSQALVNNIVGGQLFDDMAPLLTKCLGCSYKVECGGGCLATRLKYYGTPHYEAYCEHRVELIEGVKSLCAGVALEAR